MDGSKAHGMPWNFDVERRVSENHSRKTGFHQCGVAAGIERVSTIDPVRTQQPEIAFAGHRNRSGFRQVIRRVGTALNLWRGRLQENINLGNLEAGRLEI